MLMGEEKPWKREREKGDVALCSSDIGGKSYLRRKIGEEELDSTPPQIRSNSLPSPPQLVQ